MLRGLRGRLRDRLLDLVDEAELLTSDDHVVNVMVGGFNPVGLGDPHERIEACTVAAVEAALEDLRDAEVAGTQIDVGEILVFGRGNTIRLSSAINSAVSTAKGALLAAFGFASVVSAFALWLVHDLL
jgi:putative membrane protein